MVTLSCEWPISSIAARDGPLRRQQGAVGVAQVVEPQPGQSGSCPEPVKLPNHVPRIQWCADRSREDQAVLLPSLTGEEPFP